MHVFRCLHCSSCPDSVRSLLGIATGCASEMGDSTASAANPLMEIFAKAGAPDALRDYFISDCQLISLDLFLDYVVRQTLEQEIKDTVVEKFKVNEGFTIEQQRLFVSKARGAYRIALQMHQSLQKRSEQHAADQLEADIEKNLDPETIAQLKKSWSDLHPWQPVKSMRAAPALRNRVFREFRNYSVTLHTVEKAITVGDAKRHRDTTKTPLGNGEDAPFLETKKPITRRISTTLEYFSALRLLTGVYSYCGTHEVPSKVTKGMVIFFPWEIGLSYADDCMHNTIKIDMPETDKLQWLRSRDEATRGEMVGLISEGWPAGEALTKAFEMMAHYWRMEDGARAAPQKDTVVSSAREDRERTPAQPAKRSRQRSPRRTSNANTKYHSGPDGKPLRKTTIDGTGRKYCGKFNSASGCTPNERDCPQGAIHACNVTVGKGRACGRREHDCAAHFAR